MEGVELVLEKKGRAAKRGEERRRGRARKNWRWLNVECPLRICLREWDCASFFSSVAGLGVFQTPHRPIGTRAALDRVGLLRPLRHLPELTHIPAFGVLVGPRGQGPILMGLVRDRGPTRALGPELVGEWLGPVVVGDLLRAVPVGRRARYVLGIDEAGRGPVLGPMIYGICGYPLATGGRPMAQDALAKCGYADSKVLAPRRRTDLLALLQEGRPLHRDGVRWLAAICSPGMISSAMRRTPPYNLNLLSHDVISILIRLFLDAQVRVHTVR